MSRLLSLGARAGLAVVLCLLVLAVLRWAPLSAQPPFDVRALPLAGAALPLAVLAALTGKPRSPRRVRPLALGAAAAGAALCAIVWARGPVGLAARVSGPGGLVAALPPGPIDVAGSDLRALPALRKWTIVWRGPLRVPESGAYRLWADGRGRVDVRVDGHLLLEAEGERLRAGADAFLGRGEHDLDVRLQRTGPGPRLRLGWTRPAGGGRPGTWSEAIPARYMGAPSSAFLWALTDALAIVLAVLAAGLSLVIPWDRPRRPPASLPITRAEVFASALGHVVLFALMSWPLALHPASRGVTDRPDGRLNAWILAWDVHALTHAPGRLFQAPIFHPLPDALAYSENLLVPAVLSAPAQAWGGPVLAYNVALLLSMVVSALGAQLLARAAGAGRLAAFVAGAAFGVGAHRWIRLAHLQSQATLFLPLALLAFDRFWRRRTWRAALLVGLFAALQALSSIYLGAITAVTLLAAATVAVVAGLGWRGSSRLLAAVGFCALLVLPVMRPYLRARAFHDVEWSVHDVKLYATTLESYAASGVRLYGGLTQRHLDPDRVRDTLFPGLTLLVLGLVGLSSAPPRYRAVAVLASAFAILLSLGPETALYRFLHENVILFRGVRALSRFSLVPVLALCVLSAFALTARRGLVLPALALMLLESSNVPIRYAAYEGPPPAARRLAGGTGAVVYLPLGDRDTQAMLDGITHFRPLVNGDSGFVPRPYTRAMELLEGPLGEEGRRFLRAVGVTSVVSREEQPLPLVDVLDGERIHELGPGEVARPVGAGRDVPALWSREGARVDLAQTEEVGRVVFTLDDGAWVAAPRVWLSLDGAAWREVAGRASLADATLSLVADPVRGKGEVRFEPQRARHLRLDPRLPARPGLLAIGR